jgi:rhamnosyltransferase
MAGASVIVRSKNEIGAIERCLTLVREQTEVVELIVVDSGSTDGTLGVARRFADRVIEIAPEDFTFGGALNVGASAATADVHVALSAHCFPHRRDWIGRALDHYADPAVAGTFGARTRPGGAALDRPWTCRAPEALSDPYWGFTNHASSWRAETWERFPFDEGIEACEDREWSWRVLRAGHALVADPLLWVSGGHRRDAGLPALFRRTRREARALATLHEGHPYSAREALRDWWSDLPPGSRHPPLLRRLNPPRAVEIAARVVGERDARAVGERDARAAA